MLNLSVSYQNSDRYSDALNSVAQVKTVNPTQGKKHFAALFIYFNVSQNAFLFTHHATVIGEAENATDNKEKKHKYLKKQMLTTRENGQTL